MKLTLLDVPLDIQCFEANLEDTVAFWNKFNKITWKVSADHHEAKKFSVFLSKKNVLLIIGSN